MIHIKMKYSHSDRKASMSFLKRTFIKTISMVIPIANPDFEQHIEDVEVWLLEFENEDEMPNREIGIDKDKKIRMKMPYKENYGYWVDNNLIYKDFISRFEYEVITKDDFEKMWNQL